MIIDKLIFVYYKGGRYDGCIWEPNMAIIDKGEYKNFFGTGIRQANNLIELKETINKDGYNKNDFFVYDFSLKNELELGEWLVVNFSATGALYLSELIEDEYEIVPKAKCAISGDIFDVTSMYSHNTKHAGGLVYKDIELIGEDVLFSIKDVSENMTHTEEFVERFYELVTKYKTLSIKQLDVMHELYEYVDCFTNAIELLGMYDSYNVVSFDKELFDKVEEMIQTEITLLDSITKDEIGKTTIYKTYVEEQNLFV